MNKGSKTRSSHLNRSIIDADLSNTRPLRVPGATVTAWYDALNSDLANPDLVSLSAGSVAGATVAGSESALAVFDEDRVVDRRGQGSVLLSDGTRITFGTTKQFDAD
jgi:hypothetical protein